MTIAYHLIAPAGTAFRATGPQRKRVSAAFANQDCRDLHLKDLPRAALPRGGTSPCNRAPQRSPARLFAAFLRQKNRQTRSAYSALAHAFPAFTRPKRQGFHARKERREPIEVRINSLFFATRARRGEMIFSRESFLPRLLPMSVRRSERDVLRHRSPRNVGDTL